MRKPKLTEEEIQAQRQEKIEKVLNNFSVQLRKLDKHKQFLVGKVVEAKQRGLKPEEQKARNMLGKVLDQIHRTYSMQLQLELFLQDRDLSNLQDAFKGAIADISEDIDSNSNKNSAKKTKKKYLKSIYQLNKQDKEIDDVLETADAAMNTIATTSGQTEKYNDEIDSLVSEEELKVYSNPFKTRY